MSPKPKKQDVLRETLRHLAPERARGLSLLDWAQKYMVTDDGQPLSLAGHHEPLREIYEQGPDCPELAILKGAQVGVSTFGIALALWRLDERRQNAIYYLPTDTFASSFGATRFGAQVKRSAYLNRRLQDRSSSAGVARQTVKEISTHYLHILGLWTLSGAISVPSDCNLYDEVDVLPREHMEWSEDRIAASALGQRVWFSVGMTPGDGIDALYEASDQRRWIVPCPWCRHEQVVEEDFPKNVIEAGGHVELVCARCKRPLDVCQGRWEAKYPERRRRGYRIPQLIIPQIPPERWWGRWQEAQGKPSRVAKFHCSVLAQPDAGDMQPIDDAVLARMTGDYVRQGWGVGCYLGVDVGDWCHLVVLEPVEEGRRLRTVHLEEFHSDRFEERLTLAMVNFDAAGMVIDAKPLRAEARRVARKFPERTWLQNFKGHATLSAGEEEHNGVTYQNVSMDRDEWLDELTDLCRPLHDGPPGILLPKSEQPGDVVEKARAHLKRLQKEKAVDAKGNTIHKYRDQVENHFGMALANALAASRLAKPLGKHQQASVGLW